MEAGIPSYKSTAKGLAKYAHNSVLIIADEDGRISWDGIKITPYTFAATFFPQRQFGTSSKSDEPHLVVDKKISKKIFDEADEETSNPLKQIEIRKKGLVVGSPLDLLDLKYFRDTTSGKGGYLFEVSDQHLQTLSKSGIEYELFKE